MLFVSIRVIFSIDRRINRFLLVGTIQGGVKMKGIQLLDNPVAARSYIESTILNIPKRFSKKIKACIEKARMSLIQGELEKSKKNYVDALRLLQEKLVFLEEKEDYQRIVESLKGLKKIAELRSERQDSFEEKIDFLLESLIFNNAAWVINDSYLFNRDDAESKNYEKFALYLRSKHFIVESNVLSEKKYRARLNSIKKFVEEEIILLKKNLSRDLDSPDKLLIRSEKIFKIYSEISKKIKEILVDIFKDCERILGSPSFPYAVICFGSLAKETATNYSDVEFAFLIDACETCDNIGGLEKNFFTHAPNCEQCKEKVRYLKELCCLVAIEIINLKQTVIPKEILTVISEQSLEADFNLDDILERGILLDPGGKTPLGALGGRNENYTLIQTPRRMSLYLDDDARSVDKDKLLHIEIAKCVHLHGDKSITIEYQKNVKDFFSSHGIKRANDIIFKDFEKYEKNDLKLFFKSPNVKQEIYRPFTAFIENWSLYKGIYDCDIPMFMYIGKLVGCGLEEDLAKKLKIGLGIALEFRLLAYSTHGRKKDSFHLMDMSDEALRGNTRFGGNCFQFSNDEKMLFSKFSETKKEFVGYIIANLKYNENFGPIGFSESDERYNIEKDLFDFTRILQSCIQKIEKNRNLIEWMTKNINEIERAPLDEKLIKSAVLGGVEKFLNGFDDLIESFSNSKSLVANPQYCFKIILEMLKNIKITHPRGEIKIILRFFYYVKTNLFFLKELLGASIDVPFVEGVLSIPGLTTLIGKHRRENYLISNERLKEDIFESFQALKGENSSELESIFESLELGPKASDTSLFEDLKQRLEVVHNEQDYKNQIFIYREIALIYFKKNDFISAITIYNFALGALNKWISVVLQEGNLEEVSEIFKVKNKIQALICGSERDYLKLIGANFKWDRFLYLNTNRSHRDFLTELRRQAHKQLTTEKYSSKEIYEKIALSIKEFIRILLEESIQLLGNPPCSYALVGLGSLAREEATPYSDFEFAILISDESCKKYFKNLTNILNIKILNLGETSPKIAYIDNGAFSFSFGYDKNPVLKGFTFDSRDPSGCKIPLGNRHLDIPEEHKFELINTPEKLSEYQSEYWYRLHRSLPIVLQNVTYIAGDKRLLNQYQALIEKCIELVQRQVRARELLLGDIMKFEPRVGKLEAQGRIYPVKYDLYRLPNLVFDALAMYCDLKSKSTYARIDELQQQEFLGSLAAEALKNCVDKVAKIRLSHYLKCSEQSDDIIFDDSENVVRVEIYKVLIYLLDCSCDFAVNNNNRFKTLDFIADNALAEVRIYEKMLDYERVISICEKMLKDFTKENHSEIDDYNYVLISNRLGLAYLHVDRFKDALEVFECAIKKGKQNNPAVIGNYAKVLGIVGRTEEAEEQFSIALKILNDPNFLTVNITQNDLHISLAEANSEYGMILLRSGSYLRAIDRLRKAVELEEENFKNIATPALYRYQQNLATMLVEIGEFEEAHRLFDSSIKFCENQLGCAHPQVARTLFNKAQALVKQGKYQDGIKIGKQALKIYLLEQNNEYKLEVGDLLNDMAVVHMYLELFQEAIVYAEDSLIICKEIYGNDHEKTAMSYLHLSNIYSKSTDYNMSFLFLEKVENLSCYEKSLTLKMQFYSTKSDAFLKQSTLDLTLRKALLKKALFCIIEALKISEILFNQEKCVKFRVNMACYLNNKGDVLCELKEFIEAEKCFEESNNFLKSFFKDGHPSMITNRINMANLYIENAYLPKDYRQAICYLAEALELHEKMVGRNRKTRNLFEIYSHIAIAFYHLNEKKESKAYVVKAQEIAALFHLEINKTYESLFSAIEQESAIGQPLCWAFQGARLKLARKLNAKIVTELHKKEGLNL